MKPMELLRSQEALGALISRIKTSVISVKTARLTTGYLQSQIELIQKYWDQYHNNHFKLLGESSSFNDDYFQNDTFCTIETIFTDTISYLYDELNHANSVVNNPTLSQTDSPSLPNVPLPRINISKFSGKQQDWESFRDLFRSLVHNNTMLSPVQKLYYLKGSVEGDAKQALDSISNTDANYTVAWKMLLSCFDNKRLLIQEQFQTLFSINPLKKESAADLKKLQDDISRRRDSLQTIGCPVENWDEWFSFLLAQGMDSTTRRD